MQSGQGSQSGSLAMSCPQVSRVKADSRLALLRLAGVETDSWVTSAMSQANEELESERRLSEARLSNGAISPLVSPAALPEHQYNQGEDYYIA